MNVPALTELRELYALRIKAMEHDLRERENINKELAQLCQMLRASPSLNLQKPEVAEVVRQIDALTSKIKHCVQSEA